MTPDEKARELGLDMNDYTRSPTLEPVTRVGNTLYASGHVSRGYQGKLGKEYTTEEGQEAARICAVQLLQAAYTVTGTLNNLRCVKLLGAVNCTPEFTEQHLVINGASQLIWDVLGRDTNGAHARSALGFVSLPVGYAVEVEAIFEVLEES